MKCTKHAVVLSLLLLLPWLAPEVRTEVAVAGGSAGAHVIILGITEGPDPIPQVLWGPVRDVDESLILNAEGAVRGDGRPDIALDPATGTPHVVWAFSVGQDHDIAYSTWTGTQWTEVEFLTSAASDEAHPRLFVEDDGTIHVVWWEVGSKDIYYVARDPGTGQWSATEQVGEPEDADARPSVAVWNGQPLLAWESENQQGHLQIVVAAGDGMGGFVSDVVSMTHRGDPLDVVLHVEQGRLWMDWRSSAQEFAYSEFVDGEWTEPAGVAWADPTWTGEVQARMVVRAAVLSD